MNKNIIWLCCFLSFSAIAEENSSTIVTPVFNNIVAFTMPADFKPAFETTNKDGYINESIPKDQTLEDWKQMISLTGAKDFKSKEGASPSKVLNYVANGFKESCPDSFSGVNLGIDQIDGRKAAAGVVSCGKLKKNNSSEPYSETAMVLVLEGDKDYYTIQWAERSIPRAKLTQDDLVLWSKRSSLLSPIKLCKKVSGESAPYKSCFNKK